MKKHANDWVPESPTPAQLKEFFAQIECGRITKLRLQVFLCGEQALPVSGHLFGYLKFDKAKEGWILFEDVPFYEREFAPEFLKFLKSGETSVSGGMMRLRAEELGVNTGQHHAEYLLEHQDRIPKELQGKYLIFPRTVWLDGDDVRGVPCLDWDDGKWYLCFRWLARDWGDNGLLVGFRE